MYCNKCGSELRPGAKFCGICGASVVDEKDDATDKASSDVESQVSEEIKAEDASGVSQGNFDMQAGQARRRSRRRMPMALIVAIVILALATIASAAYLVYTQVFNPNPPAREQVVEDEQADEAQDGDETDEDAGEQEASEEDAGAQAPAEEAPAEQAPAEEAPAEPVSAHDYECDYFYIDAPDTLTFSGTSLGGPYTWCISGPTDDGNGNLVWQGEVKREEGDKNYSTVGAFTITIGPGAAAMNAREPYQDFGTTSDGQPVNLNTAGSSSIFNDYYGGSPSSTDLIMTLK